MADPISLSASLAGLIALTDAIFRAAFKYAKSAKHAKEEAANLATEAQDLAGVLHRLSLRASALELDSTTDQPHPTLRLHHVISCRRLLLRVEKALAKSTKDFDSQQSRDHVKRALKWPFTSTDTKELMEEIARHKGTLMLALTADSMDALGRCLTTQENLQAQIAALAADVSEASRITTNIEMNERKRRVLDFFMPVDPQRSLAQCLSLRHPMTGTWLIDGDEFGQWLAVPHSRLWLTGIPGAGKTVLAGAMMAEVLKLGSSSIGAAFFFCEYKDRQTQQSLNIFQVMASQLALQNQAAYKILEEYYKELQPLHRLGSSPSFWKMRDVLVQMAACFKTVYMIIDGLDECGDNAPDVADALSQAAENETSTISLAILSRDEYTICEVLQDTFTRIDIEAQKEDVRLFVATEIATRTQLGKLRLGNMALKDEILHALVDRNGGMFRWVVCQLDYLCELPRDKDRRQALTSLPPTLNETYRRILERVDKRGSSVRRLVQRCLQFIGAADPPLTIWELREAVSVEDDTDHLDQESLVDETTILQHCSSLVRVRQETYSSVEFSHFSVAEYLQGASLPGSNLEQYRISQSEGCRDLATTCLRFISLNQMSYRPTATPQDVDYIIDRHKEHPFYSYAALCWLLYASHHLQDDTISGLVRELFNPQRTDVFLSWTLELCHLLSAAPDLPFRMPVATSLQPGSQERNILVNCITQILPKDFTTLHMAAALGLSNVCRTLVEKGADVNAMCTLGTPLHCAMSPDWLLPRGREKFFMGGFPSDGNLEPDSDEYIEGSSREMFDAHQERSVSMRSCTWYFSIFDHERPVIVEVLLENGARVLNWAEPLQIQSLGPIDREPDNGGFPLFHAALATCFKIKNLDIVTKLLKAGLALQPREVEHFHNLATLSWTSQSYTGENDIRNHLISFLAAIRELSSSSRGAAELYPYAFDLITSMATENPSLPREPSSLAAHPNQLEDPFTVAVLAAQYNNDGELQQLLESNKVDLGRRVNSQGDTILHIAVRNGSTESVQLLLKYGSDHLVPNSTGGLPVWLCTTTDAHCTILSILLDCDPSQGSITDINGNTIWHIVASQGSHQVLRVLIEKSPNTQKDLSLANYLGKSPLELAMTRSQVDHAILMIDCCPVLVKSWSRSPPLLHMSARLGSLELAQKLIDTGFIDTKARPANKSTPLHYINHHASISFVRFLKSLYPNVEESNDRGVRPLEAFVENSIAQSKRGRMVATARAMQIFDELLPTNCLSMDSGGVTGTFWEKFCSGIGSRIPGHLGNGYGPPANRPWIGAIVTRLLQLGVLTVHEEQRNGSGICEFISAFENNSSVDHLTHPLLKLFEATKHLEKAITSSSVVGLLHRAVEQNVLTMTEALLGRGVSPNKILETTGCNALHVACGPSSDCSLDVLEAVLRHSDRIRIDDLTTAGDRLAPIHLIGERATIFRNVTNDERKAVSSEKLTRLVHYGADPNRCTGSNIPAIILYIERRSIDLAIQLLDLGADAGRMDDEGYDAIIHAVLCGAVQFLARLRDLERQNSLDYKVPWSRKVKITWDGKWRARGRGIPAGRQPDFLERSPPIFKGCSALHLAALQAHRNVVEFYLQEGLVDIEDTSENGWTALQFATYRCSNLTIRCLHKWGADMNPSKKNKTEAPFQVIGNKGRAAIVSNTLMELGAKLPGISATKKSMKASHQSQSSESNGDSSDITPFSHTYHAPRPGQRRGMFFSPLHLKNAIIDGNSNFCSDLWERGIRTLPCPRCAPISLAVISDEAAIVEWLMKNGAGLDVVNCPKHMGRIIIPVSYTSDSTYLTCKKIPWLAASREQLNALLPLLLSNYLSQGGNILDEDPDTPLITAIRSKNFSAVPILLGHVEKNRGAYK